MTARTKTFAAVAKFNAMDFCGMTPVEIGRWWRAEISPDIRAVEANAAAIEALYPERGRAYLAQIKNNENLAYSLRLLRVRLDREIEAAAARSHNRMAA
jgi:hypothetical protein